MKKTAERILTLILAACMLIPAVSCSEKSGNTDDHTANTPAQTEDSAAAQETEPEKPLDYLGEHNFEGRTYTVLVSGADNGAWRKNPIHADAENAEIINSERFKRNVTIEDTFNITLADVEMFGVGSNAMKAVENAIKTNDELYNSVMLSTCDITRLTLDGYFTDIAQLPGIDLSGKWWDQRAVEDMMINKKMYHAVNAACTTTYDATFAVLFNKEIAADYQIAFPYENVYEGSWTYDLMYEMVKAAARDLDGNGIMNDKDLCGLELWSAAITGVINSGEEYCCRVNEEGEIVLTLETERVQDILTKFISFASDPNLTFDFTARGYDYYRLFAEDHAFFYMQEINQVHIFRDMESDFGILPMPKFNEEQANYRCTVAYYDGILHSVPHVISDEDFTGIILEALARLSEEYVMPAYYETTLQRKASRDEESSAMLDIIFTSRAYDLGWLYEVAALNDTMKSVVGQSSVNISTVIQKKRNLIKKALEKINKQFDDID